MRHAHGSTTRRWTPGTARTARAAWSVVLTLALLTTGSSLVWADDAAPVDETAPVAPVEAAVVEPADEVAPVLPEPVTDAPPAVEAPAASTPIPVTSTPEPAAATPTPVTPAVATPTATATLLAPTAAPTLLAPAAGPVTLANATGNVLRGGFEIDGDLTAGSMSPSGVDWNSVSPTVIVDGFDDATQISGSESNTNGWAAAAASAPGSADIGTVRTHHRLADGGQWLYLGLDRDQVNGTVGYAIELNQDSSGSLQPVRTAGDLRLNVGQSGNGGFDLGSVEEWSTAGGGQWVPATAPAGSIVGVSNDALTNGYVAKQFLEVAVQLSAINQAASCSRSSFTEIQVRSRSSMSLNSSLGDRVEAPVAIPPFCADVQLVKSHAVIVGDVVHPGDTVTYHLDVTNAGSAPAAAVVVTDTVPAHVAVASITAVGGWTSSHTGHDAAGYGGVITWTRTGVLAPGATQRLSFTATLTSAAPSTVQTILNAACVATSSDELTAANNCDDDTVLFQPRTLLTLVKVVAGNELTGGTATAADWDLSATATGAPGVTVQDVATQVAPGVAYTLAEAGGPDGYAAGEWLCTNGQTGASVTLALGQAVVCTVTNTAIAPVLTLAKVVNDGGLADGSAWTLTAAGPVEVSGPGNSAAVTAQVVRTGTYGLTETVVDGYINGARWTCTDGVMNDAGTAVDLALGDVAVCTIVNDGIPAIELEKTASLAGVDLPGGSEVKAGTHVTWTYTVTNTGTTALDGLVVTDDMGVSVTCPAPAPEDVFAPGESVVCTGTGPVTARTP